MPCRQGSDPTGLPRSGSDVHSGTLRCTRLFRTLQRGAWLVTQPGAALHCTHLAACRAHRCSRAAPPEDGLTDIARVRGAPRTRLRPPFSVACNAPTFVLPTLQQDAWTDEPQSFAMDVEEGQDLSIEARRARPATEGRLTRTRTRTRTQTLTRSEHREGRGWPSSWADRWASTPGSR